MGTWMCKVSLASRTPLTSFAATIRSRATKNTRVEREIEFAMGSRWVVRRDTKGRQVGEPLRCFLPGAIVAEPGLRTLEQCITILLIDGECAEGNSDKRVIKHEGKLSGYIHITEVDF
jgi:hypothetical protein